ncbi:MAG: helix-turn-helix transcriptional regulator [Erysipelotrichaceae bacterium]|nr:helix-turn-helix transcriptional regulator [Erysipelotrichaceae bacterium]
MSELHERIKELRNRMHLSQDYVARYLGISRSAYTQMENGKRKVLANEIALLSTLFGVSSDNLLNPAETSIPVSVFARSFENLSKKDQEEIMNLIKFKEQMNRQKIK